MAAAKRWRWIMTVALGLLVYPGGAMAAEPTLEIGELTFTEIDSFCFPRYQIQLHNPAAGPLDAEVTVAINAAGAFGQAEQLARIDGHMTIPAGQSTTIPVRFSKRLSKYLSKLDARVYVNERQTDLRSFKVQGHRVIFKLSDIRREGNNIHVTVSQQGACYGPDFSIDIKHQNKAGEWEWVNQLRTRLQKGKESFTLAIPPRHARAGHFVVEIRDNESTLLAQQNLATKPGAVKRAGLPQVAHGDNLTPPSVFSGSDASPDNGAASTPPRTNEPAASRSEAKTAPASEGAWMVVLYSYASAQMANDKREQLAGKGIKAERIQTEVDGKRWYRIVVPGFPSSTKAKAYMAEIKQREHIPDPWVTTRQP